MKASSKKCRSQERTVLVHFWL